jgi:hypothetical protein
MGDEHDDRMASETFLRQVGRRQRSPRSNATSLGQPPNAAARAALTQMAQYRTRVPKGIFVYASHAAANQDWECWRIETMRANSRVPTDG